MRTTIAVVLALLASTVDAQVMEQSKRDGLVSLLPRLADKEMDAALRSPEVLWYTNAEMPACFQHAIGNGYVQTTLHSAFHNFSGDDDERRIRDENGELGGGNGNRELPWNVAPGGAHNAPGVNSFKGLLLPRDESGDRLPVVWFRQNLPARGNGERIIRGGGGLAEAPRNGFNYGYGWTFPAGARLFEAITMRTPDGRDVVFSVRVRIRESDAWGVDLFAPVASAEELANVLEGLPGDDTRRTAAIASLRSSQRGSVAQLTDIRHTKKRALDVTGVIVDLPPISTPDVHAVLNREWVSSIGETWATVQTERGSRDAVAPANRTRNFSLVPPNHWGEFAGNNRDACMNCHSSVNRHVTQFEQPRGWYGRIRGSDGIFSFHPFDPRSISSNGGAVPVRFRQKLIDEGFVAAYDPSYHPSGVYSRIRGLY